jgi:NAD(P)-dependent dehydrogenase (short-subunit alcohol dehydrogenase family)
MGNLDNKSVIVTGAGRGIGRGEALLLAAEGASVLVNDVDADEAKNVVEEIVAAGGNAEVNTDDVASWAGAEAAVAHAVDRFGRLDILVNNAGIIRDTMSFSMDEDQWDSVIRVHLRGHAAMSHFAGAHWRGRAKAGEEGLTGRIVNTASESGLYGLAGQINYATAKAGIASMTIVLARELKKYGVTVNAIAPRARTRMTETVLTGMEPKPGEFDEWDPANVAPVVAWLASPDASHITAQVFVVNGDKVHLMTGWERVGRIDNGGERWTVDTLAARAGDLFGDRSTKLPPAGFGE